MFACQSISARPSKIVVWFLSAPVTTKINLPKFFESSSLLVQIDFTQTCVPMGDGCFHPQLGYVQKEPTGADFQKNSVNQNLSNRHFELDESNQDFELKTFNVENVDLVECKEGQYFDIFCGKSANDQKNKKEKIGVWLDYSSSLRSIDYVPGGKDCLRKIFVDHVRSQCEDVDFAIYNTSMKELGSSDTVCLHHGNNDSNRLMKWIESSTLQELYIITDIDEMSNELESFLVQRGAEIKGVGVTPVTVKNLDELKRIIAKSCSQKKKS